MEGNYQLVTDLEKDKKYIDKFISSKINPILAKDKKAIIKVEEYSNPRSLSANRLYWAWLKEMAAHFSKKGDKYSSEDMHDIMRHKFLGYQKAKKIGKTEISKQLKSTAKLTKSEFCYYMEKIDHWCVDHGLLLPKAESEYTEFLAKQES